MKLKLTSKNDDWIGDVKQSTKLNELTEGLKWPKWLKWEEWTKSKKQKAKKGQEYVYIFQNLVSQFTEIGKSQLFHTERHFSWHAVLLNNVM